MDDERALQERIRYEGAIEPAGPTIDNPRQGRIVYFLHIPKTAGTSIASAVSRLYRPEDVETAAENVGVALIEQFDRTRPLGGFAYGHPEPNVLNARCDRLDVMTFLRNPRDQAVSNFLHMLAGPDNPGFDEASVFGFSSFMRQNWQFSVFQTIALAGSLAGEPISSPKDVERLLGGVLDLLEDIWFVGVVEKMDESGLVLSSALSAEIALQIPVMNAARARRAADLRVEDLTHRYDELRSDPHLSYLMAIENAVYLKANDVLMRRLNSLSVADLPKRQVSIYSAKFTRIPVPHISSPFANLHGTHQSFILKNVCEYLIYGPYEKLKKGVYGAEFLIEISQDIEFNERGGMLEVEVARDMDNILASYRITNFKASKYCSVLLKFEVDDEEGIIEYRILSNNARTGCLVFYGVNLYVEEAIPQAPANA